MEKEYFLVKKWWRNAWGGTQFEVIGYYYATEDSIKELVKKFRSENSGNNYGFWYEKISYLAKEI